MSFSAGFATIEKIADAILFEGYILYPYRPSSIKNQQRWNFGTLYPRDFAIAQNPPEAWSFHTEVLVEGSAETRVDPCVRFLQIAEPAANGTQEWGEGFARTRVVENLPLAEIELGVERELSFAQVSAHERNRVPQSFRVHPLTGRLSLRAMKLREGLYRLSATFANITPVASAQTALRKSMEGSSFTSAHIAMRVENGGFVSILDPAPEFKAAVAECSNQGVFPVLVGEIGDRSWILCSPIILYDYPQVAPESAGDFFDGTEMDEMLALRVLTLTDEEKFEMRRSDRHARAILDRTETLPKEALMKVHGAVRGMQPAKAHESEFDGVIQPWSPFDERPPLQSVRVFGVDVRVGDRVRIWPQKKADIMDMAMEGKVAVIEGIEQDFEDNVQFAVVLEDDPGKDMGMLRQAGHRFFFSPEEVEPLAMGAL
jgi:hypothetical protein